MSTELVSLALRYAARPGTHETPLPALQIVRADATFAPVHSLHKPSLCFIAQGTKVVTVAGERLRYGDEQFLFSSVELPISGEVVEATRSRPYLVLVLEIEPSLVFELAGVGREAGRHPQRVRSTGMFVGRDRSVSDAFTRLLRALVDPLDAQVIAPMVVREIVYRLLRSPYGDSVREIGLADSQTRRIATVIEHLKRDYVEPQSMADLARLAGMSVSSFHAHFRKVTRLTPLQYQKQLQLHEARRLLLGGTTSAAEAAFRVGYESASQFSREYARHFGLPPISDVRRASLAAQGLVSQPARARPRNKANGAAGPARRSGGSVRV